MEITMKITIESFTDKSVEAVRAALTKGVYQGLDRECSRIALPANVKIEFLPDPIIPDTILPIPIKEEDYKEYSTVWYYSIESDTIDTACNPEYFCELDYESGVFLTKDEAVQFKELYLSNMIKFNELKETWELI